MKKGRAAKRPAPCLDLTSLPLEAQTETDLPLPGCAANTEEVRAARDVAACHTAEVRGVREVEELRPELCLRAFLDLEFASDIQVGVPNSGVPKNVAAAAA